MTTVVLPERSFSRGWRWVQQEGDWVVPGSLQMSWIPCNLFGCKPRRDIINQAIQPRQLLSWTFTDTNDRYGVTKAHSTCDHMHFAEIVF